MSITLKNPTVQELQDITATYVTIIGRLSYEHLKFLAKNKNNWAAAHKTQYPNGEMVHFNPCTKLNNNKVAQGGGCSQGSIDNVVTTNKTKNSVISKNSVYETIAKKTGKSISEIKKIITRKK